MLEELVEQRDAGVATDAERVDDEQAREELRRESSKAERRSSETHAQRAFIRSWPLSGSVTPDDFGEIPSRRLTRAVVPERAGSYEELVRVALRMHGS